jgi:hypothetical protein
MGIYDQLSQLDKNQPSQPVQQIEESTSLNPEPAQSQPTRETTQSKKESQKTSLLKSKKERKQESKKERMQESKKERFLAAIQPYLDLKASNTVSFRYPDTLLEWLEESLYRLKKEYGQKLTKNAILVAALAFALWDLEQNGRASFLYQQFIQDGD